MKELLVIENIDCNKFKSDVNRMLATRKNAKLVNCVVNCVEQDVLEQEYGDYRIDSNMSQYTAFIEVEVE